VSEDHLDESCSVSRARVQPPAEIRIPRSSSIPIRNRVVVQRRELAGFEAIAGASGIRTDSFAIAKPFAFDRGRDKSQPFYAVILASAPLCSLADGERVRAQQQFPRGKVFSLQLPTGLADGLEGWRSSTAVADAPQEHDVLPCFSWAPRIA
jgi:hypothetical protein